MPSTKVPDALDLGARVHAAALKTAEALRLYAYGRECYVSDQSSVLAAAKGWDIFADALHDPAADAD